VTAPPPRTGFEMAEFKALDPFLDSVRQTAGVSHATLGPLPLVQSSDMSTALVEIDGRPLDLEVPLEVLLVDAEYFTILRQPLVRGRDFTVDDTIGQSNVGIVNEAAARTFWGNDDPLYRNIRIPPGLDAAVVGVVRDARLRGLDALERPALYILRNQASAASSAMFHGISRARGVLLIVRTGDTRSSLVSALNRAAEDVGLSVAAVRTVDEAVADLVMPQRLGRTLLSGLGLTALIVTLVGVYGFVSGIVTRRTREFGVRLALGASAADVLYATLRSTLAMVAAGLAAGLALAWWAGRFVEPLLYGITPTDPATLIAAAALIAGTALLASLVPAWRALRIDPVKVLRLE
jgi:putative ABC transport system permease protein